MTFPRSPRVIYDKNPLQEVECELEFPPILRISSEDPVEYQELIRQEYPLYETSSEADLPSDLPPDLLKLLTNESLLGPSTLGHEFNSSDGMWSVDLTRDSLRLTSYNYRNWEDFEAHLSGPLSALLKVYSPSFFTAIRMRYSNTIVRSRLGLTEFEWSDLLRPHIAGELSSNMSEHVLGVRSEVLVDLKEMDSRVLIRHGSAGSEETDEVGYVIESRFSTEGRVEVDGTNETLRAFKQQAGRLFRWCIKKTLHEAMGPHPA